MPEGIDPGFDYNVGQEWTGKAPQIPANATLTPRTALSPAPLPVRPEGPSFDLSDPGPAVTVLPAIPAAPGVPIPRPPGDLLPRPARPARPTRSPEARPPIQKDLDLDLVPVPVQIAPARSPGIPIPKSENPWPWEPRPRRKRFVMTMEGAPESAGVFRNLTEARKLANELMAGIPDDIPVRARWRNVTGLMGSPSVRLVVDQDGVTLIRTFTRVGNRLVVEHDYFALAARYQGGGHASRMLQTSFSAYERLGVSEVRVHANIDKGGYVWARNGFVANDPARMRTMLERFARQRLTGERQARLLKIAESSPDTNLMYDVATTAAGKDRWGMQALLGSNWWGHVDLTAPAHRQLLARALRR